MTIPIGVNLSFCVKRWAMPARWARLVREELGQARHIVEHLNAHGYAIERIARGRTLEERAACPPLPGCARRDGGPVGHARPVLLGTAMVAAVAAGCSADLFEALDAMARRQNDLPADPAWARAHDAAFRIYRKLFAARNEAGAEAQASLEAASQTFKGAASSCPS